MGGTLTNFLICCRRRLLKAARPGSALLLVPGPAAGSQAPPGGSMSRFALPDPAPTPLPPGSSKPAAAAVPLRRRRPAASQSAAAPRLISMGCARLMNIQRRRLAPARLPHFRPDPQHLPTGKGEGGGAAEAHYLPGGPNHLDSRWGVGGEGEWAV